MASFVVNEYEFFIVQHGQGSNNGKRSGYEAWLKEQAEKKPNYNGDLSDDWDEFPTVPDDCDIIRMAFPLYVFMSTDEVNKILLDFIKDSGETYSFNGSFYQVMRLFLNRANVGRKSAGKPIQVKSHGAANEPEPENNMKYLLQKTLQLFSQGKYYFDELLEGDLTSLIDNDFGIWMRRNIGGRWYRWVQIFGQNGAWATGASIPLYGNFVVNSNSNIHNTWRYPEKISFSPEDNEFMKITSGGCTEYRISSLISFLKRIFSLNFKANFIFANCSSMGQHKCPIITNENRLTSTGTGRARTPSSAHKDSCLSSRVSRVSQWVKSYPYDITSQITVVNNTDNDLNMEMKKIYKYWIKILETLYRRITLAKEGNVNFHNYILYEIKVEDPVAIENPELGRCLTIMDVAERKEWYQVIGSLLYVMKNIQSYQSSQLFEGTKYDSVEAMNNDLEYIIDQGSRTIYNDGISPVINNSPNWTLSSTFIKRRRTPSQGRRKTSSQGRKRNSSQGRRKTSSQGRKRDPSQGRKGNSSQRRAKTSSQRKRDPSQGRKGNSSQRRAKTSSQRKRDPSQGRSKEVNMGENCNNDNIGCLNRAKNKIIKYWYNKNGGTKKKRKKKQTNKRAVLKKKITKKRRRRKRTRRKNNKK